MRRLSLVLLCLALASCGDEEAAGDCEGSFADAIVYKGHVYLAGGTSPPRARPGAPVEGAVRDLCGGATRSVAVQRVQGLPPEVALYPAGDTDRIFLDPGYFTALREHPLHDRYHGGPDRPRLRTRGARCRVDGEVASLGAVQVTASGRRVDVGIDARTRIVGFERAGLPYLQTGDRVRIHGYGCDRAVLVARRIEPRP